MNERMIYTDKLCTLEEALEQLTDEWIEDGNYCDRTVIDLRDTIKDLLHGEGKEQAEYPICESCGMRHSVWTMCPPHEMRHREKEQPEYHCEDCGKPMTKAEGGDTFTVCEKCWDKHYKRKPKKPSHAQTREEPDPLEAWLVRMPRTIDFPQWYDWADKFTEWFREMPRGK